MKTATKAFVQGKRSLPGSFIAPSAPVMASPIAGPNDPIGLKVEIYVNSAWTDISPFVYYRGGSRVKITRGKPDETSTPQPQTCTFIVNNRDGRFSPRNPLGPYYGQIGRNTPVRVSRLQNGVRRYRFHGEIPAWPSIWDISGTDVIASVTAAGQLRRLSQGNLPLHSTLYRAYALGFSDTQRPVAYWPCEDGTAATSIASGFPVQAPMTLSGQALPTFASDTSFVCSQPLPLLSASTWAGTIPAYAGGDANVLRFLMSIPASGAFDTGVLARMYTTGTVARLDLQYGSASNGQLRLAGYSDAGSLLFDTGYVSPGIAGYSGGFNNLPVRVSMELLSASPFVGADFLFMPLLAVAGSFGEEFEPVFVSTVGTVGHATQIVINPDGHFDDTAIGHVVYVSAQEQLGTASQPLNAWITDLPTERFLRLCTEQSVPALVTYGSGDATSMGYQLNDTFINLIQEPASSTAGLLFESRDQAALVMRTRASLYNQTAKLTLDMAQHQLSGPPVPVDDDALTRNNVTVTRINGSSATQVLSSGTLSNQPPPNGVGDYPTNVEISLGSDSLLADQAGWRLHLGTVDQPRYPSIPINLRHPQFTLNVDLLNAVLAVDIGDRVVLTNPPRWLPPDQISQILQGYSEEMGIFEHDMQLNCSPEDPYKVAVLEDAVLGRADTDGSTLSFDISPTALMFQVATTNPASPLWTTSGAEFPLDIVMGGERITLSGISGASSPQTFTASARSVNGVVKAQTADTDIRLAQPMILSL